ncbi:MAG: hypothetical protein ACYCPR_11745 [Thermoplasmataceae archaeon]|jgi:hypothetical protein
MEGNTKESAVIKIRKSTLKEVENARIKAIELARKSGNKELEQALNSMGTGTFASYLLFKGIERLEEMGNLTS